MIHTQDADFTLHQGDVTEVLQELPDESVHCVVTSPPYWGLRDYGTGSWDGGNPNCDHRPENARRGTERRSSTLGGGVATITAQEQGANARDVCPCCGARRVDHQLGLEPTPDAYVTRMVEVFREVRRVLRSDGTCWVNLGDSYAASRSYQVRDNKHTDVGNDMAATVPPGLKPKDLVGIPWRVAFALQADGWYLRSDIIWSKPNPMPESVTDRPTKAHEYVFLLSKSPRYFFDQEAVREKYQDPREGGDGFRWHSERYTNQTAAQSNHVPTGRGPDGRRKTTVKGADGSIQHRDGERWPNGGRNVRSVWEIATQPYPEAHFATYPEELVRRCILAGTSEKGCCPVCGKPWEREVERHGIDVPRGNEPHLRRDPGNTLDRDIPTHYKPTIITLGWRPGCDCACTVVETGEVDQPFDPVPCTVLDPFMGSGTTAFVARAHGRRSIGIELNPEYCALAAKRLQQQSLFA